MNSGFPSYSDPTRKLIAHIRDLSLSTQDFLQTFPSQNPDDPAKYRSKREQLWLIRAAWKSLHFYVQPAVDANTLNVPTELVQLLTQRVRAIDNCESLEFAVIHTDKLNYFQFPPGDFQQTVIDLGDVVSAKWAFPPDLGLIALPHSQAQHLFLNGLLAHEIGHFVFAKLNCFDRITAAISEGLRAAFAPPIDTALNATQLQQFPEVLQDWAEELFCDLFGVYLLGPSFVLASIELFDLPNILAADGTMDARAAGSQFKFEWSHPARLFRLSRQTALLESLGWWNAISENGSHHIRIMDLCRNLRQGSFSYEEVVAPLGSKIIDAFFRTVESIEAEVARVTEKLRNGDGRAREIAEFVELKDVISTYLCQAVIPSTLFVGNEFRKPSAIVLLNAAHLFYLSGIEDLMSNSDKPDLSDIRQRDIWMERVENWTTKGLEDIALPNERGG
ncbi:MAG TPA: hypothetical protein VN776_03190 [Terracidiphilus sp.]|nr:hypothetical protein [Terracidiphilus sp.]